MNDIEAKLAASLKELTKKEAFEKITIRQITDGAGVIRVTFYNHFKDKYDLLEWIIFEEVINPVRILLEHEMYRDALILIFNNVLEEKAFYMRVARLEGQNSFREIITRAIRKLLFELFTEAAGKSGKKTAHSWLTPEYMADYYAQSMAFIVLYWIDEGMPIGAEEMATIYEYIASRSMWDVLKELQ